VSGQEKQQIAGLVMNTATKRKPAASPANSRMAGHTQIVAILGSEILSGTRQPGSRLPSPEEMFSTFGVSRVVLREVTRTLAAKGMVKSKTKVGPLVQPSGNWNWLDPEVLTWRSNLGLDQGFLDHITQLRMAVEPAAAAQAARNRSEQDLAAMRGALKGMRTAGGDHDVYAQADLEFHVAIGAASGNPLFRSLTTSTRVALFKFLRAVVESVYSEEHTLTISHAKHAKVFEAIAAQDEDSARAAMIAILEHGHIHATSQIVGA
jgi:DNA-binding FadR family transcriptional regulator